MDLESRVEDYRARSARCLALAKAATTPVLQALWLEEAGLWTLLQEQGEAFDKAMTSIQAAIAEILGAEDA